MEPAQPTPPVATSEIPESSTIPSTPNRSWLPLLFVGLLIIIVIGVLYILFRMGDIKPLSFKPATQIVNESPANQTSELAQAFQNEDFDTIINYLSQKVPDSSWMTSIRNSVHISYSSNVLGSPPSSASSSAALKLLSSTSFGPNGTQIKLDQSLKNSQPFVGSAVLLTQLRKVYDDQNGDPLPKSCLSKLIDTFEVTANFWGSLSDQERAPINGFNNLGLNIQNDRYNAYKSGQLENWTIQKFGSSCQTFNNPQLNASGSSQPR